MDAQTVPNPNEQTAEQIAEQIANQATQPQQPQIPEQFEREYVVQTETGQTFRGKTQKDVIDALKKSVEEGTKTIAQFNREKQQVVQPAPPVEQKQAPAFDGNMYYEKWAQNAPEANIEALDYALKQRFGIGLEEFVTGARDAASFTTDARPRTIITEWMQDSDFPTGDPSEMQKANEAMQTVWNEQGLEDIRKMPPKQARSSLELVHNYCLQKGMYRSEKQLQQPQVPQPQQGGYMPTLESGSGGTSSQSLNPNTMSLEQIRQMLENAQQ